MLSDMVTYHEGAVKDRLKFKFSPMSQTYTHANTLQYDNLVEDKTVKPRPQNPAKIVNKEVRVSHISPVCG